ncbi:sporulation integral membrane protein YlbJ [Peribacillus castrilensis]|uniref:Sporulation integral membrane protein YlbJ n=1 Tax=Peribacillus simplex TaxID=1478 RepID=A0AAN2TS24_9BACI|nr:MULTISPECIES: sporulation integral membrane protein YlbJ [Bacillaceae]MCP1092935.1 sporulation integral membrane protein YlbJ [Bacillaceae bacterium OS4b]MBD8587442.1 sporulation integral membrane protein YlbJ [Peribacillus simplex]MCF7621642.1 sporulation integral membrane protein YlbJ [Peribacillus frigoritolerans]MCP1152302.1 sporulation integral membrane protein YlbJ [Peribacillus frigoritolerans]MCT1387426.1 sporulation integral membrane protein YlbJ [Peribacillus frigoritolerans]
MLKSKSKTVLLATSVTMMAVGLIIFPQESFEASKGGLNIWWTIVFPSLLPFLIFSELLISFGVVRFIGVMLEPFMRPLFRVPGVGGFVWAMGLASGFPAGAKFTVRLRQEEQLTRIEAERLVCFTNSSNPLFLFVAVAVGFFHNPHLGIILALSHYLGNICVGIIMRFYRWKEEKSHAKVLTKLPSIRQAFSQMHRTRIKETRPFGSLLGDAVLSSIQTLLMIGGFIILFSVVNKLLFHMNITGLLASGVGGILHIFNFPDSLSLPFISGMFEMTLGSKLTSTVEEATLFQQTVMTSFILAFNGFSIQAQVASIIAATDIRFTPFFLARIAHGLLASIITVLLWEPFYKGKMYSGSPINAFPVSGSGDHANSLYQSMLEIGPILTLVFLILYIIIFTKRLFKGLS